MPSLNWIGKEKIVNHDKEVPFRLLKKNKKLSLGKSENLIVEGDNLEALKALMPFYHGRIKCIYIDPPYNTGNEKWVYNDKVNSPRIKEWLGQIVDGDDLSRHDKWLCMMYPRLQLLRDLLSEDGAIFVSIDDNEQFYLRALLNEIFKKEDNFISCIVWKKKTGAGTKIPYVFDEHEYVLVYAKDRSALSKWRIKSIGDGNFRNPDNDRRGPWESCAVTAPSVNVNPNQLFMIEVYLDNLKANPKAIEEGRKLINSFSYLRHTVILREVKNTDPLSWESFDSRKNKASFIRRWAFTKANIKKVFDEKKIYINGTNLPRFKKFEKDYQGKALKSLYYEEFSTQQGSEDLKKIFGTNVFEFPKPVSLIEHFVKAICQDEDIILDSFAGSGTTGHAVLEVNKEDGGNRKFILVEMEKDICRKITSERIRRVAKGYSYKKNGGHPVKVEGLGGGFEYVELGEALFNSDGMINKSVSFEDMARYVFFTETHTNLDKGKIKGNYIGEYADTSYFLLFDGIGKNVLNRTFLKKLKTQKGNKVVYADKCLLGEDILEKHQIIFKQIPYSVKVY